MGRLCKSDCIHYALSSTLPCVPEGNFEHHSGTDGFGFYESVYMCCEPRENCLDDGLWRLVRMKKPESSEPKQTKSITATDLNTLVCQSFFSTLSEKLSQFVANSRNSTKSNLGADSSMVTLSSMWFLHTGVHRQRGDDAAFFGYQFFVSGGN